MEPFIDVHSLPITNCYGLQKILRISFSHIIVHLLNVLIKLDGLNHINKFLIVSVNIFEYCLEFHFLLWFQNIECPIFRHNVVNEPLHFHVSITRPRYIMGTYFYEFRFFTVGSAPEVKSSNNSSLLFLSHAICRQVDYTSF